MSDALFEYLLRQGDNALVLGHRVSEWCGVGPAIEEDIALANTALDLIGQAQMWLERAAEAEGAARSADDLAYGREAWDFRNLLLVEQPNGDFGQTIMRQFLFDAFNVVNLTALETSTDTSVAEIAAKSVKEARYHLERSRELVVALGDGSDESHARMQTALDRLWAFAGEMFLTDTVDEAIAASGTAPLPDTLRTAWESRVRPALAEGTLEVPEGTFAQSGGKTGTRHSEHLGHMLAVMQSVPRAHPGARW